MKADHVFQRSRALADATQQHGVVCLEPGWLGWHKRHRVQCAGGHVVMVTPASLLRSFVCRDCKARDRLTAMLSAADAAGFRVLDLGSAAAPGPWALQCKSGHQWSHSRGLLSCPQCAVERRRAGRRLQDGLDKLRLAATARGGACLAVEYRGLAEKHRFRCEAQHEWDATAGDVLRGTWCPACAIERKKVEYLAANGLERLRSLVDVKGGLLLTRLYQGLSVKVAVRCAQRHLFTITGARLVRGGWCAECAHDNKRLGIERARQVAAAHGGQCLSSAYRNATSHLRWLCERGHEWSTGLGVVLRGHWCPECAWEAQIRTRNSTAQRRYRDAGSVGGDPFAFQPRSEDRRTARTRQD